MLYTVIDIETTGFNPRTDDIIQFSYLEIDERFKVHRKGTLYFYYEGMSWGEEAYQVHGIPQSYLRQYKDEFFDNVRRMYVLLQKANVVGHNSNGFDLPFCNQWLQRMGMPQLEPYNSYDTMQLFRPIVKQSRIKLGKLANMMGFTDELISRTADMWFGENTGAHDARYDVAATAVLFNKARHMHLL